MAEEKINVAPDVFSYADSEHSRLSIETIIPGVKKKDIDLKIHEDSLSLSAPRRNINYSTTLSFCCPVRTSDAKAKYENGS